MTLASFVISVIRNWMTRSGGRNCDRQQPIDNFNLGVVAAAMAQAGSCAHVRGRWRFGRLLPAARDQGRLQASTRSLESRAGFARLPRPPSLSEDAEAEFHPEA